MSTFENRQAAAEAGATEAASAEAVIFRPARTAMQAGMAGTRSWVLEFLPRERLPLDPLTGWTGSRDTRRQVGLRFPSREAAEAYARQRGLAYVVKPPHDDAKRPKSYADNFRADRLVPWSH